MIERRTHGAAHHGEPTRRQPLLGGAEQRLRHGRIIHTFEEAPEAHPIGVHRVVLAILDGRNAANRLAVTLGQEERATGVPVEGVLPLIERVADDQLERRHPLRVIGGVVEAPGEINKATEVG